MKGIFKEIKRHIQIYGLFIKNCLIKQMMYRANFFMMLAIEATFLFVKLLYVGVVYNTGVALNAFSPDAVLLFSGTYIIISGIHVSLFFFNFSSIQQYVKDGSLDLFITKPVSLQFITTLRNVDFATSVPNLVAGIVITVIGWQRMSVPVTVYTIIGYIGYIICGIIVTYALMLAPQLLCFFIVKGNALNEMVDSLWNFNSMPMSIYKKWMQTFGTFVFPIFLISNFSPLFVLKQLSYIHMIWGLIAPIILLVLVRLFWKFCIKNYTSASS